MAAVRAQARLATTSYFDGRPDARHFVAHVDDVVVSIRENLPTYGVTDGEVWAAWRRDGRLFEQRFADGDDARRHFGQVVLGTPLIVPWNAIARAEYAVFCPVCEAALGQPCVDGGKPMLAGKGIVQVVSAPYRPEPHDVEVKLAPLVHAGRITRHHQALRGKGGARA